MRSKIVLSVVCLAALGAFSSFAERLPYCPLKNADILFMTRVGVSDATILTVIECSTTDFDIGVDNIVKLTLAGVGDEVVAAMVKASAPARRVVRLA